MDKHLQEIQGIYIINYEPGEILAVSANIKAIISKEKLKIALVPIEILKKDIKTKPEIRKKISKAQVILNNSLLSELKKL